MNAVKPRHVMTEDESIQMLDIRNEFYEGLSRLVAEALKKCPAPDLQDELLMQLQDQASVYGSAFERYL